MGSGRGKGSMDQTGVIAAGCGAIYCIVCFFLFALPMLIAGILLIRFAEGDWDGWYRDRLYDCREDKGYPYYSSEELEDECGSWSDWDDTKDTLYIVGIVLIIISLLFTIVAVILLVLMCAGLCRRHKTRTQQPVVMTYDNQPVMYPVATSGQPVYIEQPPPNYYVK